MAEADGTQVCSWKSERGGCGLHFIVSDDLTRPVLVLDSALRVSAINEFDPYGHANRQSLHVECEHPYAPGESTVLGRCDLKAGPGEEVETRVLFAQVDTEGVGRDYVRLESLNGAAIPGSEVGGPASGRTWTPWVDEDQVQARFVSSMDACCAESCDDSCEYAGVVAEACEFRRYQKGSGVIPMSVPLRFPGQYQDRESDLFENWYRYYAPSLGRYMQSEPMVFYGYPALNQYSYAASRPLFATDPDGRKVLVREKCEKDVRKVLAKFRKALKDTSDCTCKKIADKYELSDKFERPDEDFLVICYADRVPGSRPESDGCGFGGEKNEAQIAPRPDCIRKMGSLAVLVLHELAHVATRKTPAGFPHVTEEEKEEDFNKLADCIQGDGTLLEEPNPYAD